MPHGSGYIRKKSGYSSNYTPSGPIESMYGTKAGSSSTKYPQMGEGSYSAKGGPNRKGRGKYSGDHSGMKAAGKHMASKPRQGGPAMAKVKIGGIATHSKTGKDYVEPFSKTKKRLNRM